MCHPEARSGPRACPELVEGTSCDAWYEITGSRALQPRSLAEKFQSAKAAETILHRGPSSSRTTPLLELRARRQL